MPSKRSGPIPGESFWISPIPGESFWIADFRKQIQVAVDGSKADIRELPSDIQIYGLGGRVIIPGYKKILDRLPLFTVLQHGCDTSFP